MRIYKLCLAAALLGAAVACAQERDAPRGRIEAVDAIEVLTRGPVHEAFAQTVTFNPEPGIVIPRSPPEAIEEVPPEYRPQGDNVAWIPGYWAWDDERSDFLWVSGIWRNLPPGRQWVPGYWGESEADFQWTSGYWADAELSEVAYLPEPPATVEAGPNIEAPSQDYTWQPGCWLWRQTRYAWRPGYWAEVQPDWLWVPAYYAWTPRGYVFIDGYWDYSIARRGILFAPVYIDVSVYSRRGFYYSPATVINPAVFASQLFLRPHYQHYYFGDYYAASYSTSGYYPWFSYNSRHDGYDPIYAHYHWQHRQDRDWEHRMEADFLNRRDHEDARPPRTWAAQKARVASEVDSSTKSFVVAAPLAQLVKSTRSPLRFQAVAQDERQTLAAHGHQVQEFRRERRKLEVEAVDPSASRPSSSREFQPAKVKLPRSPVVAPPADRLRKDDAPPTRHKYPEADSRIEPKPRNPRGTVDTPKSKPEVSETEITPDAPKGKPTEEPKPERPKVEPKPGPPDVPKPAPKVEPKRERPKVEPKPGPPDVPKPAPKVEPKPERPKVEPKPGPPDVPKPAPKVEPKPERPKVEPKPGPPDVPKPAPKVEPKPKPEPPPVAPEPKPQPKPVAPKPQPKPKPPEVEPTEEPTPEPTEALKDGSKE